VFRLKENVDNHRVFRNFFLGRPQGADLTRFYFSLQFNTSLFCSAGFVNVGVGRSRRKVLLHHARGPSSRKELTVEERERAREREREVEEKLRRPGNKWPTLKFYFALDKNEFH
jgi:hypothetical protein